MSTIKLPELPVRIDWHDSIGIEVYSASQMREYAEQAVRQALAAQETRAWLIRERKNGTDPMFTIATTTEPFESSYWPLALIPEANHGKPS